MNRVELIDLPQWSPWAARLLGLAPWTTPSRTIKKVDQEYDKDKYAKCLDYYRQAGEKVTPEEVKRFEFSADTTDNVCVSFANDLFEISPNQARRRYYQLLLDAMRDEIGKCKTVVELGAGYGYNLWMLHQSFSDHFFIGGDCSKNAVLLSTSLYENDPKIEVREFNFYDATSYNFLELADAPIVVFTSHAIEQLHSGASPFFDALMQYREKIQTVFHFEPVYQLQDETLLGLLRRRYTEVNDYNRDLLSESQSRSAVQVVRVNANVLGLNPLNPTSVIQWDFDKP